MEKQLLHKSVWRRWESTLIWLFWVSVTRNLCRALNEKWAGENGVGGGRLLKLMEQHIMKLIRKHNLPCIWAVATKQSIILPFQKVKVTYLKIKVRIIKTNLEDILQIIPCFWKIFKDKRLNAEYYRGGPHCGITGETVTCKPCILHERQF